MQPVWLQAVHVWPDHPDHLDHPVPGAYQGRGRGNQFLADLCTADVLIHVIDASGLTDEGGNLNDR